MATKEDLPERRIKNYFAAIVAAGSIIIGIILIIRYSVLLGLAVSFMGLVVAALLYRLNNKYHEQEKAENNEPPEFK